jgi:hypothetical protein
VLSLAQRRSDTRPTMAFVHTGFPVGSEMDETLWRRPLYCKTNSGEGCYRSGKLYISNVLGALIEIQIAVNLKRTRISA